MGCQAMIITSLRDGMNLVSFEWTVCQQHKPRPWNANDAGSYEVTPTPPLARASSCSPSLPPP